MDRVVIVGASLAGLRAAETLRSREYAGDIVVVGAEPHRPYDRPPLSKKLLAGEWEPDRIELRQRDTFDDLDVAWRLGVRACALEVGARSLTLDDGTDLGFDSLIIACGAAPKRLPGQERHRHAHVLRTLDDALALRAMIAGGDRRVAVIGAGFIGHEVAATAHSLGNEVVVLEAAPAPMIRGLGERIGRRVGELLAATGLEIRCNVSVEGFEPDAVMLADGRVPAEVVLVGVGVAPATSWLDGSGLQLRDGIVCDAALRALDADGTVIPGIFAAGDVARWPNELVGEELRIEHWTNAAEQGAHAADNVMATSRGDEPAPYAPVPFVWSDQGDLRIQFVGHTAEGDDVEVIADDADAGKLLALYHRDGRLRGAVGINAPRWVMPMRQRLLQRASFDEARPFAIELTTS